MAMLGQQCRGRRALVPAPRGQAGKSNNFRLLCPSVQILHQIIFEVTFYSMFLLESIFSHFVEQKKFRVAANISVIRTAGTRTENLRAQ